MNENQLWHDIDIQPDRLMYKYTAWVGHIPFAAWLITELKPKIFVELGTHTGTSFMAFCQTVKTNGLDTSCYAVDTWQGDEHAGFYDESVFEDVSQYLQGRYATFAQLLRMTFDEATSYFSDGSIDLLHIDGLHTYEAVKHDFETWLPKLSDRGIVLFHDINVRERNFGVWRLWEELTTLYPGYAFKHSHGLGVLLVGKSYDKNDTLLTKIKTIAPLCEVYGERLMLQCTIKMQNEQITNLDKAVAERDKQIADINQELREKNEQIAKLKQALVERDKQIADVNQELSEKNEQIAKLKQALVERDKQIADVNQELSEKNEQIAKLKQALVERDKQIANLNQAAAERDTETARLANNIEMIYRSRSWRITAPLRFITTKIRHFVQPKPRWGIGSQLTAALLTLPATFWFYGSLGEWFGAASGGKAFFAKVLDKPENCFNRLRQSRRLARISVMVPLVVAHLIRNYGCVMPVFYEVYKAVRRDGMAGARWWISMSYHDIIRRAQISLFAAGNEESVIKYNDSKDTATWKRNLHETIDIEKYEYFFIDVFDTAITRLFRKPSDIFRYISFSIDDPNFYMNRIEKEAVTRTLYPGRKDISLSEIYEGFYDGALMDYEVSTEYKFCVANPEIYQFYRKLIAAGKRVYFVSDMYLEKAVVTEILIRNGYSDFEDIFVSSDDDLIKGDGSRFGWIKKTYPETIGNAIHIGDNYIADYEQPKKHGFDAFHYTDSDAYYKYDEFVNTKIEFLTSKNSLGLSFILGAFRFWKSSYLDKPPGYWRQFGFLYGGALVSAFCQFIHENLQTEYSECRRIFFLGRDGDIMCQVYKLLFEDDIEAVHLMASRRCIIYPAIKSLYCTDDSNELMQFINPLHVTRMKDIMERFGYDDLYPLENDLIELGSALSRCSEKDIYECIIKNKKLIMDKIIAERTVLYDYLSNKGFFEQDTIVVVDVGWGGSIQNSLIKLIDIWGFKNKNIYGMYLGVNDNVLHKDKKKGYLFNGDTSLFSDFLELIELITSSPLDPVYRIEYADGEYRPVSGRIKVYERIRQDVAKEIQQGIFDFARIIKEREIDLSFVRPDDYSFLFEALKMYPSVEDLRRLGQIRHAMMIGNNYALPVLKFANCQNPVRHDIKIITVYINQDMYDSFFTNNFYVNCYALIGIDNRSQNRGLSSIYNEIIDDFIDEDCWLFFVHEDFKINSDLHVIDQLDPGCVYGTFGVRLEHGYIPVAYGRHICSNKDGSSPVEVGVHITQPVKVQTLDCQSILLHTSLLSKYPMLRFDESLSFDLYVEDFCVNAQERYGIEIKVFPLDFQHYSHGNTTQRYYDFLQYLAAKYPTVAVPGPCSFIGGRAWELEARFQYDIPANRNYRKFNQ